MTIHAVKELKIGKSNRPKIVSISFVLTIRGEYLLGKAKPP